MKKSNLWAGWAAMYSICLTFSFIPNPQGVLSGFMLILGLLFFLPPAMLLYWAIPRREFEMIRRIRTISLVSLVLTFVLLILNFMSLAFSYDLGMAIYVALLFVSVPMVCSQAWVVSLFLWACPLMVCLTQLNKQKKKK